jgi:hypothetical protein
MDYQKHYNLLINKARGRILEGYVEKHHIIPLCIGGTDSVDNLVALTPEEHFLAHQLLIKIYPGEHKLVFAVHMMCNGNTKIKRKNKMYGWLRKKCNESLKLNKRKARKKETKPRAKRILSEEHKIKIGLAMEGRSFSEETKLKISAKQKGRIFSEETKLKMRKPKTNRGPKIIETFEWECQGCGKIEEKRNLVKNREQKFCSLQCFYSH